MVKTMKSMVFWVSFRIVRKQSYVLEEHTASNFRLKSTPSNTLKQMESSVQLPPSPAVFLLGSFCFHEEVGDVLL
jgi:hypothetical protein